MQRCPASVLCFWGSRRLFQPWEAHWTRSQEAWDQLPVLPVGSLSRSLDLSLVCFLVHRRIYLLPLGPREEAVGGGVRWRLGCREESRSLPLGRAPGSPA